MTQEYFPGGEQEDIKEMFRDEVIDIREVDWEAAPVIEKCTEHPYTWLKEELNNRIIGQPEAIDAVVDSLLAEKLRDKRRPIATIMFLGPTGVGKTETAEALADILSEDATKTEEEMGVERGTSLRTRPYTRIDCSEFSERSSVNRLTGSAPGYVGYGKKTQLNKSAIEQYQSVVLFDEFEKAHPDFQDILLQVTSNGELTLGKGDKISFRNSIIIITSNLGSTEMMSLLGKTNGIGFRSESANKVSQRDVQKSAEGALKKRVRPEFYNRINKKVVFNPLDDDSYAEVIERSVKKSASESLRHAGVEFFLTPELVKYIVETTDERREFGARPVIDRYETLVLSQLGEHIGSGAIPDDSLVRIGLGGFDKDSNEQTIEFRSIPDPYYAEPEVPRLQDVDVYRHAEAGIIADIADLAIREGVKRILSQPRYSHFNITPRIDPVSGGDITPRGEK